jgi:uncharacterized membrane protein
MAPNKKKRRAGPPKRTMGPFRRAVLRGLAILLPPLLTIVIFLWVGNSVAVYLLEPMEDAVRYVMVERLADIRTPDATRADGAVVFDGATYQLAAGDTITIDGEVFQQTGDGQFIPVAVQHWVRENIGQDPMPRNAKEIYTWYVDRRWLPRELVVPVFLLLFVLALYLLGKFLAAGMGRFFWNQLERVIQRLPLVSNVYSSVKQVTDFMITDPDIQYTRVVAVEYPRKGIWTLSFVTGEGMLEVLGEVGEPMLTVLIPTSPMPFTGFTMMVKKSETLELDITLDQAFQFIVSCGVVVPAQQITAALEQQAVRDETEGLALAASVRGDD